MKYEHRLLQLGVLLFLLGLFTGFAIPILQTPRLGLASHLEGIMNGMFLILIGLLWRRLTLSELLQKTTFFALVFGTYVNWLTVLLAAFWAAGSELMPIAGGNTTGTTVQEGIIKFGLVSLSLAMVYACLVILWGLKNPDPDHN